MWPTQAKTTGSKAVERLTNMASGKPSIPQETLSEAESAP